MSNTQYIDQTTVNLVNALIRANRMKEANEFAATITDESQRSRAQAMISGNATAGSTVQGLNDQIQSATHREEKLSLYRKLFTLQNEAKDISAAVETIEKMIETVKASPRKAEVTKFGRSDDAGVIAAIRAMYLTTAKTLLDEGKTDAGMQHLAKAKAAIMELADETGLTKIMLINQLIGMQIAVGDLTGARGLLPLIKTDHTRAMAARSLAMAYIGEMDMTAAREIATFITGKSGKGSLVGDVAAAFVTADQPFYAQELLATLGNTDDDGQAYRSVARAMIKKGQTQDLLSWLEAAPSPIASAYACIGAAEELQQQ